MRPTNTQSDQPATRKPVFFENLDALRFLSFLVVFFFHSFYTEIGTIKSSGIYAFVKRDIFGNGNLGVNFFFVLSGFLITYLLIEEKNSQGSIHVRSFWIRRILRIWPLFYLCVAIGFFVFPFLKTLFGQQPAETASMSYYLVFLNNFDVIRHGSPDASILGVLWSVAIEEQFYFFWPVALYFLPVKKYWIVFVGVITASLLFRYFNRSEIAYEFHTLSCIGDMAVGAIGAWLIQTNEKFRNRIVGMNRFAIVLVYLVFWICFIFRDEFVQTGFVFVKVGERLFIGVFMLLIILEQNYSKNSFIKLARFGWMSKLGKISYGLYCLHFLGILIAITLTRKTGMNTATWQVLILETFLALGITICLAWLSFHFFEKPFLRLKKHFTYVPTGG